MHLKVKYCGVLAAAALALTACGGGSAKTASTVKTSAADQGKAQEARATVERYTQGPSAFPVDRPLPGPLPAGTNFQFLQTSPPIAAQLAEVFGQGSKLLGVQFGAVQGGSSTEQAQSGLSTILERNPSAILLPSVEPNQVTQQLRQAQSRQVPTVSTGIMETESAGIDGGALGKPLAQLAGKLLADWVVTNKGSSAKAALYITPELNFTAVVRQGYEGEMAQVCPQCKTRVVPVPLASFANAAPSLVISDLQAHPDTSVAIFAANEAATGLPVALQTASKKVDVVGFGPSPSNLQDIQSGKQAAGLGLDFPVLAYTMLDEAARLVLKAPLTDQEQQQLVPVQFLTKDNLKGDVSKGWSGYPDFASRFKDLWQVG